MGRISEVRQLSDGRRLAVSLGSDAEGGPVLQVVLSRPYRQPWNGSENLVVRPRHRSGVELVAEPILAGGPCVAETSFGSSYHRFYCYRPGDSNIQNVDSVEIEYEAVLHQFIFRDYVPRGR